jgi:hypothetical protein
MVRGYTVDPVGDPFHDVLMGVVALLMALFLLGSVIGFAVIYYGDDVARPSWNNRTALVGATTPR